MKLKIEFHYPIRFTPYRHQNARSEIGQAAVEVEIRELSDSEAPVAMLVGNPPNDMMDRHEARLSLKEDGSPRRVRTYMGRHFVEAGSALGLPYDVEPARIMTSFFGRAKPRSLSVDNPTYGKKTMTGEGVIRRYSSAAKPFRTFNDDHGAAMAARLERLASLMFVVDGIVYEYTPEPIIRITDRYGEHKAFIGPRPSFSERHDHDSFDFHMFEFGEPIRSSLLHADTVKDLYKGADWPFFEVVDPAASAFDGTGYDVIELARKLEQSLASSAAALPWNMLEAYYDLRDAFQDAQGRVTPRLVEALSAVASVEDDDAAHLADIAVNAEPSEPWRQRRHEAIIRKRLEYLRKGEAAVHRKMAEEALERWAHRPEGEHWENGVGPVSSLVQGDFRVMEVLSSGMVFDLARRAGTDPEPLLRAARDGCRVLVREAWRRSRPADSPCFALVRPDGSVEIMPGAPSSAEASFRDYLEHAGRGLESSLAAAPSFGYGVI